MFGHLQMNRKKEESLISHSIEHAGKRFNLLEKMYHEHILRGYCENILKMCTGEAESETGIYALNRRLFHQTH